MGESSLMLWSPMPGTFDRRRRDSVTAPVGTSDFLHGKEERKKRRRLRLRRLSYSASPDAGSGGCAFGGLPPATPRRGSTAALALVKS